MEFPGEMGTASYVGAINGTDLDRLDAAHVWYPFTQMRDHDTHPALRIDRGEGCWLWDHTGRKYLDGNASIWTALHGHGDPDLNRALIDQLGKVAHSTYLGLGHAPGTCLAAKLAEISPSGLDRVFYSDNGSSAVEIALKLSFQYWQLTGQPERRRVIALESAYHGDTFGAMSVGDSGVFHQRFRPWCFPVDRIPSPGCEEHAGAVLHEDMAVSLEALDRLLSEKSHEFAALILEPWVQGAAGMRLQPRGFLRAVSQRCRAHGVHLIVDEVFVAFGRCGPLLVCLEEGVAPDFLCLAKGLAGGYLPLAATLASETIYQVFIGEFGACKAFFHGHTFTGNPLATAVALKSIEKVEAYRDSGRLGEAINAFGELFWRLRRQLPPPIRLRQRGLVGAIDLPPGNLNHRRGLRFCLALRECGVLLRALGDSLLLVPPLIISREELLFLEHALLATFTRLGYLERTA